MLVAWLFLLFSPMAEAKAPQGCWVPGRVPYVGRTDITFMTGPDAAADEAKRAAVEMRDPMPTPPGGWVFVKIARADIDAAAARNHTVVVAANGREVLRVEGDQHGIPEGPYTPARYWTSFMSVPIKSAEFPLTVYAIDKIMAHRCAWELSADGDVAFLKSGGPPLETPQDQPALTPP
jgi:hypothetical protein